MDTVQVSLGERSYPIHIGPGLIDDGELLRRCILARQVMIVTNEIVAPLYLGRLERALNARHSLVLPDGEEQKNLATLREVIDRLVAEGFRRDACLVALGGGVIGDLTGFAAACYQRGIAFVQIPTTLLAQVDSSVGGKTAVNHPQAKNMIGAFHQPIAVLADTDTLASLPEREFSAGMAEVIKHGLILDESFLLWLEENMEAILDHDAGALAHIVRRSCEIKAAIVAEDELEQGRRALLNLGHTFGHALESLGSYRDWLHGEAVAVGITMAAWTSKELGMIDAADCRRVETVLSRARLPTTPGAGIDADAMLRVMNLDKKAGAAGLKMILLERLGGAVVTPAPDPALLRDVIDARAAGRPRPARRRAPQPRILTRPELVTTLAPYAASEESSRGRVHAEDAPSHRSEYQRDRDRIIHSASFRRLVYKTQVFVNHEGDHYRTRLTHSLEVAQIARSMARSLMLNEDLAEAISLAHDLGHTPFGHAGQDALDRCMQAYGGFEHNLQSLRVVDHLEQRYAAFRGLNLTFEAREGILKHCSAENARRLGELGQHVLDRRQPGLEAQLVNLADEIAYNTHDVDDGLRSGLIRFEDLREIEFVAETLHRVEQRYPGMEARQRSFEVGRAMIGALVSDLIATSSERLRRLSPGSIEAVRSHDKRLIGFSAPYARAQRELKTFLRARLYFHPSVRRMSDKAEQIIATLFSAFSEDFARMPAEHARLAREAGGPAGAPASARVVADYIAGMTDRFALQTHADLAGCNTLPKDGECLP